MIYLDHAATTPVLPSALEAAWPYLTRDFGNPSSTHELGLQAKTALENARTRVARALGARASEVIFTSGGTEGSNAALLGLALANPRGKHIVSARTEHESVLATLEFLERVHGFEISWLAVSGDGHISLDDLASTLRDDTTLVSLMAANNEIGTLHPLSSIAMLAHARGALVHTDAVQAVGWLPMNFAAMGVDALTVSGHKIGSPKGSGALLIRGGLPFEPLLHGGGQENDFRSGTENVAWAVGLATALELAQGRVSAHVAQSSTASTAHHAGHMLIAGLLAAIPSARLTGPEPSPTETLRHPGICSFVFPGINGETLLIELEQRGVIVSSGAACAAGKDEPSHVLLACGHDPDTARTAVRFSLGHSTTADDLERTINAVRASVEAIRD